MREKHIELLDGLDEAAQMDRLCELNVVEQVSNVGRTTLVKVGCMHCVVVMPFNHHAHPSIHPSKHGNVTTACRTRGAGASR